MPILLAMDLNNGEQSKSSSMEINKMGHFVCACDTYVTQTVNSTRMYITQTYHRHHPTDAYFPIAAIETAIIPLNRRVYVMCTE